MSEVLVNGVKLAYQSNGSGEPVLLVCGTGQPAFSWDLYQVPALTASGYRVLTFDNRGMPPSECPPGPYTVEEMARDTTDLIEQVAAGPCLLVGHSLGAFITQELALSRPDLVRGAVMMGTFGRQDAFRRALMKAWVELDESGIELPRLYDIVYSSFSLFSPRSLDDDPAMSTYIDASMQVPAWRGPGKLGQHCADLHYDNRLGDLGGIRVPSMVIAFELDMVTPTHLCREVAEAIPGCRYVEISGVGHSGAFERPIEVNSLLLEFFAQV